MVILPFVVMRWFFFKERFDWSWLWEDSYQWSLCLLVIVWFVLMTSRMCFGQWGMFYAFCCHEAILLKIDWWSRYRLFWLVELLIYLNNDFGFEYFFWSLKLVIAFVVIVFKCLFSQPYVWRSWSQNFGLVEGVIYLFWFRGVHFSRVTALINCYE